MDKDWIWFLGEKEGGGICIVKSEGKNPPINRRDRAEIWIGNSAFLNKSAKQNLGFFSFANIITEQASPPSL